jgi:hypothetical protein
MFCLTFYFLFSNRASIQLVMTSTSTRWVHPLVVTKEDILMPSMEAISLSKLCQPKLQATACFLSNQATDQFFTDLQVRNFFIVVGFEDFLPDNNTNSIVIYVS